MSRFENAVKAAADIAIELRDLELKIKRLKAMQHNCFKEIDKQFDQSKELHFKFGERTVDLLYALAMDGQHTCHIDVYEGKKRIGLSLLH